MKKPAAPPTDKDIDNYEDESEPVMQPVRKAEDYDAGFTRGVSFIRLYADSVSGQDRRQRKLT